MLSFDHETFDPDRGIGDGVPEVSTLFADGRVAMITGSWVANESALAPDGDRLVVVKADGDYEPAGPQAMPGRVPPAVMTTAFLNGASARAR